jgi:hypothetical protein
MPLWVCGQGYPTDSIMIDRYKRMYIYACKECPDSRIDIVAFRESISDQIDKIDPTVLMLMDDARQALPDFPERFDSLRVIWKQHFEIHTLTLIPDTFNPQLEYQCFKAAATKKIRYGFAPFFNSTTLDFIGGELSTLSVFLRSEEQLFYFAGGRLDSVFTKRNGTKVGWEYTKENDGEWIVLYEANSTRKFPVSNSVMAKKFLNSGSYYSVYPILKEYRIEIEKESILYQYHLMEELQTLFETTKD